MLYTVPMKKNRLDTLLVEQGYFADADEALRAVLAHEVKVNDVYATSAAVRVAPDAEVVVKNRKRFVSRGVGGCRVRRDGCRGVAHHRARGQCGVPGARRVRRVSR